MSIEPKERCGDRNEFERKTIKTIQVTDISDLFCNEFLYQLKQSLTKEVDFVFQTNTIAEVKHTNGKIAAYLTEFYPLDVTLTEEEARDINKAYSAQFYLIVPSIVKELVQNHLTTILLEVERVKKYHPNSPLTIYFAPADTIDSIGNPALPLYVFLMKDGDCVRVETESSFVVIPNDELSKAY